jgi:hypothetical protein
MPDVLMLCIDDWANTMWRFFKCLQHLEIDVLALKGEYHRMAYPEQIPVHPGLRGIKSFPANKPEFIEYARDAKVIHLGASSIIFPGVNLKNKKVVMQHGGSVYRENYAAINNFFNEYVDATIIQCPDLLGLGATNEHWIYYPVDTDFIKPDYTTNEKLVIGHFPSNPDVKGTAQIVSVIEQLEREYPQRFEYVGVRDRSTWNKEFINKHLVFWSDNLKRMRKCDIIIETMNVTLNAKPYGEWGNTALEGSAMGNIVVTNCVHLEQYEKEFGSCELVIANDPKMLYKKLKGILELSTEDIIEMKVRARKWSEKRHSICATAQRLWDRIYSKLL